MSNNFSSELLRVKEESQRALGYFLGAIGSLFFMIGSALVGYGAKLKYRASIMSAERTLESELK